MFGYLRPKRMYTNLTEYQGTISQMGYDILRKNDDDYKMRQNNK